MINEKDNKNNNTTKIRNKIEIKNKKSNNNNKDKNNFKISLKLAVVILPILFLFISEIYVKDYSGLDKLYFKKDSKTIEYGANLNKTDFQKMLDIDKNNSVYYHNDDGGNQNTVSGYHESSKIIKEIVINSVKGLDTKKCGKQKVKFVYSIYYVNGFKEKYLHRNVNFNINDTKKPILEFNNSTIEIEKGTSNFNLEETIKSNIKTCNDPVDGNLKYDYKVVKVNNNNSANNDGTNNGANDNESIDVNQACEYNIIVSTEDKNKNKTENSFKFNIKEVDIQDDSTNGDSDNRNNNNNNNNNGNVYRHTIDRSKIIAYRDEMDKCSLEIMN